MTENCVLCTTITTMHGFILHGGAIALLVSLYARTRDTAMKVKRRPYTCSYGTQDPMQTYCISKIPYMIVTDNVKTGI